MPSIGPPFAASLDFSKLAEGVYFVVAEATVDQNWAGKTKSSRRPNPDIPPQRYACVHIKSTVYMQQVLRWCC
jgi:hypothetical protein